MTPTNRENELNDDESNAQIALPDIALPEDIATLLADEATWAPVRADLETAIIDSVLAEIDLSEGSTSAASLPHASDPTPSTATSSPENVVAMPSRWKTAALGAAAALVLVAALFGVTQLASTDSPDIELAMVGTELAPTASATAEITDTPEGTRIVISVSDLPPAERGSYYQAWLRKDAEIGVSAGTFHLRSGEGPIELWAGVSTDDYPLLTITLQQEAQTESSGQVVLKARIG